MVGTTNSPYLFFWQSQEVKELRADQSHNILRTFVQRFIGYPKNDVQDCQWLQKLMSLGLLRAAWRPAGEVCVVRAVVRQHELLLTEQGSWAQRMQKALLQMNR